MRPSDWDEQRAFVEHAVDELLGELTQPASGRLTPERLEHERLPLVRDRLLTHSLMMFAAGASGATGPLRCNDGNSIVGCEFHLRPEGEPYYRCTGHSPPHCYDGTYATIGCP